jgi:hypothetical protein
MGLSESDMTGFHHGTFKTLEGLKRKKAADRPFNLSPKARALEFLTMKIFADPKSPWP